MPRKSKQTLKKRVNRLERVTRPEVKYRSAESGAFDTIGSVQGTVLRPQQLGAASGRDNRVGDKVKSRNVRFQAIVRMPYGSTAATCAVRILALRSKIQNPDSGTVDTGDFPNFYSTVDEEKFFVMKDILTQVSNLSWNSTNGANDGSTLKRIKFNLPTGLRKLQYDGSTLQSPSNNEIVIFIVAENQNAEIAYNWQHYYIDN